MAKPAEKAQTIYLPLGVWEELRLQAFNRKSSQAAIFREAIDLWLKREGLPDWAELTARGEDL